MSTVELPSDRIAAAHLERRRNREFQRQDRIFNAKVRTIGVDLDALDLQVKERKNKEASATNALDAYAAGLVRVDSVACVLDHRQRKDERLLQDAILCFRHSFQQPASRREFDLNDPDVLRKQEGVRMLSGLAGEDPGSRERLKRQQEQLRDWSLQQQRDLETARRQRKLEDQQYNQSRVSLDNHALQLQKIEEEGKRAVALATKDFNLALAAETAAKKLRERRDEEEDNATDILNQLQGELLNESLEQSTSVLGLPRLRTDCYKGLTAQQLQHVTDCQQQQVEEKRRARLAQQQEDLHQERFRVDSAHSALLLERQQARVDKQLRRATDNSNAQLAEAHRAQKKYLEKQVYTNVPDETYFSQFNKSSR